MRFFTDIEGRKKNTAATDVQNNLKQEVLKLERKLQEEFAVRCALESALGFEPSSSVDSNEVIMPERATKVIKEIAVLELEVAYLEQHLLSLYRKAFDQQLCCTSSTKDKRLLRTPPSQVSKPEIVPKPACSSAVKHHNGHDEQKLLDSSVYRCHSSLPRCSAFTTRTSSPPQSLAKAVCAFHSRQFSMMEYAETVSSDTINNVGEHHGGSGVCNHVITDTPNRISEEMVKCISAIYCKLAEAPITYHSNANISSPTSSLSSMSTFSVADQGHIWSPRFMNNSYSDVALDNAFHVEALQEINNGPYCSMLEVSWIYRDSHKLNDIEHLFTNFRSLICRLEEVDPGKLKHEEKLAFWINTHNALVMHAFLAHGIPQNNVKRVFLLLKVKIECGWLRLLFSPWTKLRIGDRREAYAIKHPEPLLHFALCSGNYSDPAVRVYTGKRVFEELEVAKEEYIGASIWVRNEQHRDKILLPKLVELFAKDSGLCQAGVMDMIQPYLHQSGNLNLCHGNVRSSRNIIDWIPHNFTFRYLISKHLLNSII
ncbi:uncharacterized protein G2W53_036511 [Senna tora]|uniref:Uncharacterized protein n=1 Tax=Senna tora TaxID=362788 RepID=A0A834SSQ6_9FABA|nr:uncharacterized protein G2W53_036511 [Senna tora]